MKTLRYLYKVSWRSYTAITATALFSIVVAVFCVNVVLGYAETYYRSMSRSTTYTVIAVAGMDAETKQKDMLSELSRYEPSAALYFCRTQDGAVLIGFDGTDTAGNWWPEISGTFVNNYNGEEYPDIVYLRDNEMMTQQYSIGDTMELDGKPCRISGYGFIMPFNFTHLISKQSPQTVFDPAVPDYAADDPAGWFRVIPYSAFRESYQPDLILLHFPEMSYGKILNMTDRLEKLYPEASVTPPVGNSDKLFQDALMIMRRFIPLFIVLTEITLILMLCELFRSLRTECFICRICGMSGRKLRLSLIGLVALLYLPGSGIAIALQFALKGVLTRLNAGSMPRASAIALGVLLIFGISVLGSLPELNAGLRLIRSEEE